MENLQSAFGIFALLALAWIVSEDRRGLPPRYAAAVFADDPGKGEQGEDAECRLEIFHYPSSSSAA